MKSLFAFVFLFAGFFALQADEHANAKELPACCAEGCCCTGADVCTSCGCTGGVDLSDLKSCKTCDPVKGCCADEASCTACCGDRDCAECCGELCTTTASCCADSACCGAADCCVDGKCSGCEDGDCDKACCAGGDCTACASA